MEHKADQSKEIDDNDERGLEVSLKKVKEETRHGNAIVRSTRFRKTCNFLPETSVKQRKAYFCTKDTGVFSQKVEFNQMASMLQNPDMMGNMVKQNIQSVINITMFRTIGSIFSGFVIAQLPFPLG